MKKLKIGVIVAVLLAAGYIAGRWSARGTTATSTPGGRRILYYVDPMHPAYKSDKPGIAPDCGMKLEPVYADGDPGPLADDSPADTLPPGTAKVTPEKQQVMGVRLATVERGVGTRTIRAVGRVVADENRTYRLTAATEGWVRELHGGTTGSMVRKDEVLASFFSRDLIGLQQSLFVASDFQRQAVESTLMSSGMSESQLQEVKKSHTPAQEIEIRAPVTGFVLARNISPNLRFDKNAELYLIGDLTKVWVIVDAFERDADSWRPGMAAIILTGDDSKKIHKATVSNVLPQFDVEKRTCRVRLEVDNPDYALRPDWIVEVEAQVSMPSTLLVPVDAVMDAGARKTVYVDRGNGFFEPRPVKTGWRDADHLEIVEGLKEGERIVVSGTFLLDSESRMKAAAAGIVSEAHKDPVCGMDVDEAKAKAAGKTSTYQGQAYFFCSDDCKKKFDTSPDKYTRK